MCAYVCVYRGSLIIKHCIGFKSLLQPTKIVFICGLSGFTQSNYKHQRSIDDVLHIELEVLDINADLHLIGCGQ